MFGEKSKFASAVTGQDIYELSGSVTTQLARACPGE